MKPRRSFQFLNNDLHRELVVLLNKIQIDHTIDKNGVVFYSSIDEEVVDELICSIRDLVFPSWQVLTCPCDWTTSYKNYMNRRGIPFQEERSNGEQWFLIPRKHRPHSWKLENRVPKERLAEESSNV